MALRPGRPASLWVDAALAAGALAVSGSVLVTAPGWDPSTAAAVLVVAHCVPVGFRRVAPQAAFAVSAAAGAAYLALGWPMVGLGPTALVMTYSLAAYAGRVHSLVGLGAVGLILAGDMQLRSGGPGVDTLLGNLVALGAAWLLGDGARRRRQAAEAAQRRLAREAVADERLRIARELHDVVAHSMSVIAVQAGTGRLVLDDDPEHARRALGAIEQTSQRALSEMRRLLGVLRAGAGDDPALAPLPSLADVDRLVAQAEESGTPVDLLVEGDRHRAPAGVELAAYRVLQEALTNVRRHAPGAPAVVRIRYEPEDLVVEVENPMDPGAPALTGRAPGPPVPPGHGLLGMRERVSLYGGRFSAGPGPGATFRLSARIPYADGAQ